MNVSETAIPKTLPPIRSHHPLDLTARRSLLQRAGPGNSEDKRHRTTGEEYLRLNAEENGDRSRKAKENSHEKAQGDIKQYYQKKKPRKRVTHQRLNKLQNQERKCSIIVIDGHVSLLDEGLQSKYQPEGQRMKKLLPIAGETILETQSKITTCKAFLLIYLRQREKKCCSTVKASSRVSFASCKKSCHLV